MPFLSNLLFALPSEPQFSGNYGLPKEIFWAAVVAGFILAIFGRNKQS